MWFDGIRFGAAFPMTSIAAQMPAQPVAV